jgi:hypothetical protein
MVSGLVQKSPMSISQPARKNLLAIADAYGAAMDLTRTEVSRRFYGRGSFLDDFSSGTQSISLDKLERMVQDFREKWPKKTDWPFTEAIYMDQKPRKAA